MQSSGPASSVLSSSDGVTATMSPRDTSRSSAFADLHMVVENPGTSQAGWLQGLIPPAALLHATDRPQSQKALSPFCIAGKLTDRAEFTMQEISKDAIAALMQCATQL